MRSRFIPIKFALIIAVGIIVGWLAWIVFHSQAGLDTEVKSSASPNARTVNLPSHFREPVTMLKDQPAVGIKAYDQRAQRIRTQMLSENKPLALFGAVEDQHGRRVAGVKIVVSAGYYDGLVRPDYTQASQEFAVQTDGDGTFSVTGQQGISMYVTQLEKEGYLFAPAGYREFAQYYHLPANARWPEGGMNESNPVIISTWKRDDAVTLKEDGKAIYSPQGSGPIRAPITGTPMELEIEWNTPGTERLPGMWSVRIRVINGGLQLSDDVFPFEAPKSGYQQEWIGGASDQAVIDSLSKNFYITDTDKKYFGRLHATIKPYFGAKNHIGLRWWINPNSGERGLLNNTTSGD